jgi:hypothetical protein
MKSILTVGQGSSRRLARFACAVVLAAATLLGGTLPARARAGEAQQAVRPLPAKLVEQETERLNEPRMRQGFPRLGNRFEVLGPSTPRYNCIGWSVGNTNEWVWPGNTVADFDRLYAQHGYARQEGLNLTVEPGKRKLVLYGTLNPDATIRTVTHAAVQEPDGRWTSKLGSLALIRHATPDELRGPSYGTPIAVYVRPAN